MKKFVIVFVILISVLCIGSLSFADQKKFFYPTGWQYEGSFASKCKHTCSRISLCNEEKIQKLLDNGWYIVNKTETYLYIPYISGDCNCIGLDIYLEQ